MIVFAVAVSTCMRQYPASYKVTHSPSFKRAFKESLETRRVSTFDRVLKVLATCRRVLLKA
ncbi:MAG TPA: hypothetical protein VMY18_04600 [Acidobacteriota bacterium]|nr:hypothetical protein [Acidobacteriota bacterium]